MSNKGLTKLTAPSALNTNTPIANALLQVELILQAETKRREESNEILSQQINEYDQSFGQLIEMNNTWGMTICNIYRSQSGQDG